MTKERARAKAKTPPRRRCVELPFDLTQFPNIFMALIQPNGKWTHLSLESVCQKTRWFLRRKDPPPGIQARCPLAQWPVMPLRSPATWTSSWSPRKAFAASPEPRKWGWSGSTPTVKYLDFSTMWGNQYENLYKIKSSIVLIDNELMLNITDIPSGYLT